MSKKNIINICKMYCIKMCCVHSGSSSLKLANSSFVSQAPLDWDPTSRSPRISRWARETPKCSWRQDGRCDMLWHCGFRIGSNFQQHDFIQNDEKIIKKYSDLTWFNHIQPGLGQPTIITVAWHSLRSWCPGLWLGKGESPRDNNPRWLTMDV